MTKRSFEDSPAVRDRVPLLVGLTGPSSSGKTYSALRLASGMQQAIGGEIYGIDTESRRMLHYADKFTFRHIPFLAPFSPLDYLAAIEHCVNRGASIVIVDSTSHEHEGPGGVLEWHADETQRLAREWNVPPSKAQLSAWQKPKAARRRLLNTVVQLGINAIFCFRAKEKLKIVKGKDPIELGWMPICGEEFAYEMTVNCLLYPGSGGIPTWKPEHQGEKMMMKLPVQFVDLFKESRPLDEAHGKSLAEWAAGRKEPTKQKAPEPKAKPANQEAPSLLDEIKAEFAKNDLSGRSEQEVSERKACFRDFFGHERWDEVEKLSENALREGLSKLRAHFAGRTEA